MNASDFISKNTHEGITGFDIVKEIGNGGGTSQSYIANTNGKEYFLKVGETELSFLEVYNPALHDDGSSMAHLETAEGRDGDALMYYAIGNGTIRRELNEHELLLLEAMGWTLAAIPEPSVFGFLAGGLVLSVAAGRRRRKIKA